MEWTNNVVIEFLNSYEKHPVIWDPTYHMGHKNRNEVWDAWNRIRTDMSIKFPVELLKKKKESLMATYRLLRKKVMDSARVGKEEVYKPTWFAFETMDRFLNSVVKTMNTQDGTVTDDTDEQTLIDDEQECQVKEETELADKNETTETKDNEPALIKPVQKIFRPSKRRRLSLKGANAAEFEIAKCIKQASDVFKTIAQLHPQYHEQPDECSLYGQLLAMKLRSMDRRTRAIITNQIDNLVFNAEMQSIDAMPGTSYDSFSEGSRRCSPLVNHHLHTSADLDIKPPSVMELQSQHPTV